MKARKWMLRTAAAALVAGTPLAGLPQNGFISTASAARDVSVSVDFNLFYDRLDPYGDWVSYESAYVWVPTDVSADWRPYTRGQWVYTREYGWLWVSDEPFGWATYHYGRWGFAEDIGWYWVPAKRWAPAWVAWRRSDDHLAWAPLPPEDGVRVSLEINIDIGRLPDHYWVAVETDRFLEPDIAQVAIFDTRIIEEATPVGTVVVQNNTVINNVVEVNYIEKQTNKRVTVREARTVDNPESTGKLEGDAVAVFNSDIGGDEKTMKPKRAREAREVIEERKARRVTEPEESTGTVPQPPSGEQATTPSDEEKSPDLKKKRKVTPEDSTGSVTAPVEEKQEAPPKRKKKLPEDESGSLQQLDTQDQQDTQRKKKLPAEESARQKLPDEPTGSVTRQPDEPKEPSTRKPQRDDRKQQKKQKKCDPSQEDCG